MGLYLSAALFLELESGSVERVFAFLFWVVFNSDCGGVGCVFVFGFCVEQLFKRGV